MIIFLNVVKISSLKFIIFMIDDIYNIIITFNNKNIHKWQLMNKGQ